MKQIAFTAPRITEFRDVEKPTAAPGKAVVRTVRTAISSGTERANLLGDANVSIYADGEVIFPRICGYSACGIIESVGEGCRLSPGDRVAVSWSAHSEYNLVPENNLYKLPDSVSDAAAALIHIGTFPLAAIRKVRLEIGESAIVMGLGVLGLIAVQLLHAAGAAPVIAADPDPARREQALRCGADYALDPFADGFVKTVKSLTGGIRCAIEVTGNGHALDQVLDCMMPHGRVALLGCTRNSDFTIDYYRKVHGPGISLIGAHTMARPKNDSSAGWWTTRDDALALVRLHALGRIDFASMVEAVHAPQDCVAVFDRLIGGSAFPITEFDWGLL